MNNRGTEKLSNSLSANLYVEEKLKEKNIDLGVHLDGDVLFIKSPMVMGLDVSIRRVVEAIKPKKKKLVVILETNGGYIEVVERISDIFRKHYKTVDFVVPNYAYSAGTVLCMSGDNIYMDYFSVLGPIDPQVEGPNGLVPATGYLEVWKRLVEKSGAGEITTAEMNYMINRFDAAELYSIEQARLQSVKLLEDWLARYKFKNWKYTARRGLPVSMKMKKDRAKKIADILNDTNLWHSHGRGIPMNYLKSAKMKLQIEDFGKDKKLNDLVRSYYDLATDFCLKLRASAVIHCQDGLRRVV